MDDNERLIVRLRSWRAKLEAVGGYDNGMIGVPADGVRAIIDDAEAAAVMIEAQRENGEHAKRWMLNRSHPEGCFTLPDSTPERHLCACGLSTLLAPLPAPHTDAQPEQQHKEQTHG